MNRAERQSRALEMFIAGATYRQISDRLEMTEAAVEKAVQKAMAGAAARRRELLADEATAVGSVPGSGVSDGGVSVPDVRGPSRESLW